MLKGCHCLLYAIECNNVLCNFSTNGVLPFVSYHIVSCSTKLSRKFSLNTNTVRLNFSHFANQNLFSLDLSFNLLSDINFCLKWLNHLSFLFVLHNKIKELKANVFSEQKSLFLLDLESNNLISVQRCLFHFAAHILAIFVTNNSLSGENIATFASEMYSVQAILTDNVALCCMIHSKKCTQKVPWHTNCLNLLGYNGLNMFLICGVVFCFVLNTLFSTLNSRSAVKAKKVKPFHIIIGSLPGSHVLVVFFFSIQMISDSKYGNNFILHVNTWQMSFTCKLLFSCALAHAFSMVSLDSFLSLSRMMVVLDPLDSSFKQVKYVTQWLACIFCTCILLGTTFTLVFVNSEIPNRLCLPFVDVTKSKWFIAFILLLLVLLQVLSIAFITGCNVILLKKFADSQKASGRSDAVIDRVLLVQLLSLVLLNSFCWVPVSVVHLVCFFLPKYPVVLTFWAAFLRMVFVAVSDPVFFSVVHLKLSFGD